MLNKILLIILTVSLIVIRILLNITNPSNSGPLVVLAVFVLFYLICLCLLTYFVYFLSSVTHRASLLVRSKKPIEQLSLRNSCLFSTVISASIIMMVGLQSVGAIGLYSFVLILVFCVVGCFYVAKRLYWRMNILV